ncbi:MAG: Transcription initiation factor TFIID subunit 9 [Sclerophora amabilis]|nr:MAG: Transcription initiation factor TFIID subunit 9 [Sclerophora amabilis]
MAEANGALEGQPNVDGTSTPTNPSSVQLPKTTNTTYTSPYPPTSQTDNGLSKRPRDARLIHMVLAALGIPSYQERVPLQLLDFAYRYTSSTLQDALHLNAEGYGQQGGARGGASGGMTSDGGTVSLAALRLSVASRLNYQFTSQLPKEFLLDQAQERNRVALPVVGREWGVRLPPERYCLTGVGWGLKDEWESEGDEEGDEELGGGEGTGTEGEMGQEETGEEKEEGDERMEDVFGEGADGDGQKAEEDKEMNDT